jgi:hypothetical protein
MSVAFSPVIIAVFNIVNVLFNIEGTPIQFIFPALIVCLVILYKPFWINFYSFTEIRKKTRPLLIGATFGVVYWLIFFYPYYRAGTIYTDVLWNFGIINELKAHFPPLYSQWDTKGIFIYHYLTNAGFAGFSNFSNLDVIHTVLKSGNLVNCVCIFVILAFSIKNNIAESLLLFLLLIFLSLIPNWQIYVSMCAHLSGNAASTFFWSLPLLLSSIYAILHLNNYRLTSEISGKTVISLILLVLAVGFSKVSNLMILLGLEFWFFIKFLYTNQITNISQIFKFRRTLLSFIIIPVSSLLLIYLFSLQGYGGLIPGIEIKDFQVFNSWNPLLPIFAIYGPIFVFIIFMRNEISESRWEFLFCGFVNLLLFFIFRHSGYSDLYFGFNTIICNILFLNYSYYKEKIKPFLFSYLTCGIFIVLFSDFGYFREFSPFDFSLRTLTKAAPSEYNFRNSEVNELLNFSDELPKDALISVPKQEFEYTFLYSAFLGRRIWNENPRYSYTVLNEYTLKTAFLLNQNFIPSFLSKKPDIENYNSAYSDFIKNIKDEDLANFEKPEERYNIYKKCVFEDLPVSECEDIVRKYKWTHIMVREEDIEKINIWIKSKKSLVGKYYTIFNVSSLS